MNDINLTPEQKKLFVKLKKSFEACKKANIFFANNYGDLEAFNGELVARYDDQPEDGAIDANRFTVANSFKIPNEWADDSHFIHLTEKGKALAEGQLNSFKASTEGFDF